MKKLCGLKEPKASVDATSKLRHTLDKLRRNEYWEFLRDSSMLWH